MAKMSNSLVKQFAKTITQSVPQEKSKSSNALGTLVKEGNIFYAMLDGSTFLTPVSMSMSGEDGDRVLVTIQNHSAIVTSNITAPGATTKYVERIEADLTTFKDVTVKNLLANYIRTDELEAKVGTFGYLKVETAEATYLKTVELEAKVGTFGYLKSDQLESEVAKFGYLKTGELEADVAKLGYLKVTDAEATYLKVDELEGKVGTFGYLKVSELEGAVGKFGYLTADQASLKYAQIDFANVTGQVVGTSLIKDGAITDAKILGLSANKITAGILDAAKITVTNLNADNITVGTLNGKLIGTGSVDLNKLAEEVPTKEYLDSVQNGLQDQIDKSIQTYTVTAIPLLNNEPAQGWATEEYQKHVGDICYVVNPGGQADGYTYRFEKDGDTYGWSLIKDSQVTEALQKLLNVDGDLSGLKSFQSETSSWITKTDSELSSVKSRTTTIETTYSTKAEAKNLVSDAKKDLENALSTKVETTTFNEVKQTVDTNSAKITQMTKTLEQKADGSAVESLQQTVNTVQQTANENVSKISQVTQSVEKAQSTANTAKERIETISQTVNEVKQTADSNSAKITQMNQTVAQKADGSKVTKLEERTSSVEQNLSGFKSEVSSTYTTKTEFENLESTYNSYVQQTDSKIAAKLESATFNSFQNGEYSNFKKSTNEFIGTSEAWEMRWNKIFNSDNAAEDTYQSYITFQNGEQILGNSKSNIKLHLKNDVIQFEDSNGNALASFDATNIYLGKNNTSAIIDLCNGTGKISNVPPASGYRGLTIEGTDMTSIKSRYDVYLSTMAETDTETYGSSIELSTTDTPWYGDTAHGGTINLRSKGGNHVGSIVLSDGEIMLTVQDDANIAFLHILNTENRVTLAGNQIHLAGKTYPEQGIFLPSNGTWWVGGKTATNCIVACQQTAGSYHPAFRINSAGGHVWNIGGINNEIGFYGFKASRGNNDNGVDFCTKWDMNNWDLIHSGYFEAHGLINTTFEYRSMRVGGRDWRFGAQTGTGDDNQFGFYDTTYGRHGSIVGSDHSLRMIGDIFVGCDKTGNENVGIEFGGYKNGGLVYLYVTMGTQNLWLQTRVNSNTSSASWAWYNVTDLLQKSSSDKRLKTNVRFSNVNALDAIDRMCVRSFNRIDEGGLYYSIGFIADELEEIDQNLVSGGGYTEDGHPYYKSINGIYLTSYAIKGIQELHKKVNEQKNKIDQQSSQLQSALGQIEALRNKLHELEMAM